MVLALKPGVTLELHIHSTEETTHLVFSSKVHLRLSSNCRGKVEYTYA
jgi:hypothetical protein